MLRWQDRYHRTIKEERLKTISSWLVHRRNNRGVDTSFFQCSELLFMLHFEDSHFNLRELPEPRLSATKPTSGSVENRYWLDEK